MPRTTWRLPQLLKRLDVTPYALSTAVAGSLSRNAVYRLAKEQPARLELSTITTVIAALRGLTGKDITPADLLTYEA